MTASPVRVAHLVSHPIQYFAPLYRELARRSEIDLTVYFYSDATARAFHDPGFGREVRWDTSLLDGYRWKFCPSAKGRNISDGLGMRPHWDVVREVSSGRFDVLWVHGYTHVTSWMAVAAARARGMRVLIREEQTLLHRRPWYKRAMKQVALRTLFNQVSGLYIGEQNRRYFLHYGVPPARLFPARYCVDNGFFRARACELARRRGEVRASFGVTDDAPVVLFVGKFIEKKQPLMLVKAFARARAQQPCWLLLVGDGGLRAEVERLVERLQIPNVCFAGFLNQRELPKAYTAADIFVLPSALHETWGLVVNEAMNFSLPVVVSDRVGCAEDLVRPAWNGFVVPHRNLEALAHAIGTLVADEDMRRAFGAHSRDLVDEYSIESCADGIVAACVAGGRGAISTEQVPYRA